MNERPPASSKLNAKTDPRKSPRTWRKDPEGRRARILAAAAREYAVRGFSKARLARVATNADVAEGTVYHQFESKRGLLEALGEHYGVGMAQAAFSAADSEPSPEVIARIVQSISDYVRDTDLQLARFLLAHDAFGGEAAQEQNRETMICAIQLQLEQWIERKQIVPVDTRIAAEVQFGLVEAALRDCFMRKNGKDEEGYALEVTRCSTAYLAPAANSIAGEQAQPR